MRLESLGDFEAIARRVRKIDPSIWILLCPDRVDPQKISPGFLNLPLLAIYLVNPPPDSFKPTAGQLAVKSITKLEEYEHFKKHSIPCLPIEAFHWGMTLDKSIYGDWVVLKPQNLQSTGKDINMIPTDSIPTLKLDDFPEDHLMRKDSYYVQKFVRTGVRPEHYRVTIFINTIMFSTKAVSIYPFPLLQISIQELLAHSIASNDTNIRTTSLCSDLEVNAFALKVAETYPQQPLFGIDILRCAETKKLYALETNLGGNVWHFSSDIGKIYRNDLGGRGQMVKQYNALDAAATTLIKNTYLLAI